MLASGGGHVKCVKVLLDRGARINQQDRVSVVFDQISVIFIIQHNYWVLLPSLEE